MAPDIPAFAHGQDVYHVTDDTPGLVVALVYYSDCLRYKIMWQGRTSEEHSSEELTTEKPIFSSMKDKD
jgi:hypothetical protein